MCNRFFVMLLFISISAQSQHCQPDTRFLPSISFEGTAPIGLIVQAGLFAQTSALSLQAGCKIIEDIGAAKDKFQNPVYKGFPRLELSYRAAGDKDFGIHPFFGLSARPDVGVMVNLSCGNYTAFRTRFGYDGKFMVGAGAVFLIPTGSKD